MTADELKKWRLSKGKTQEVMCRELDIKLDTWRKWEQGKNPVPDWIVHKIPCIRG